MSVLSSIGRFVPPPAFLRMASAGVDVSDTSLKYVQFRPDNKGRKGLKLAQWGDIAIPEGALERGEVHDPQKLAAALQTVREQTGIEMVRVSLPEERAYLFETEIKHDTPFKEVRGLLEFRLEENVPLSPRDALFDYEIVEDSLREGQSRVLVTVYARETIMSYYEACLAAKVIPLSFEVEAQAIARATIPYQDQHTHLIVDFGKTRTGIGIVHAGDLMYTSTIDIGGTDLSTALCRQLGDTDEDELTKIKNTQGLVRAKENSDVYDSLLPTLSVIVDELKTRIQYWQTRAVNHEERQIQSVILCGGSVNLKGLPEYLTEVLGIDACRADVWQNAFDFHTTVPEIDRPHSYGYATAVGLGLAPYIKKL